MKSKKKPLVAAAMSALLALAGSVSAQGGAPTSGSQRHIKNTDTGKKGKTRSYRRHRLESGKKATKHYRKYGRKGPQRRKEKLIF